MKNYRRLPLRFNPRSNSSFYLHIIECPLCVPHHYETEEFTLTSEHNHPPQTAPITVAS